MFGFGFGFSLDSLVKPALLAEFPATAAYSVRKISNTAVNCLRVRRDSDDTEQDIGFVLGELDLVALDAFCTGANGFVATWYDQAGSNNATQSVNANQLKLYDSVGGVILENGKPALASLTTGNALEVSSALNISQPNTFFSVYSAQDTNNAIVWTSLSNNSARNQHTIFSPTNHQMFAGVSLFDMTGSASTGQQLVSVTFDGATSTFWIDGAGETNGDTGTQALEGLQVPGIRFTPTANINLQELIIYNSDERSNRLAIESDINGYYSIF